MSRLEYSINAIAWSLVGVVLTLTYQRIMNWWRSRQGEDELPPISANTYFGTLLVLFSIVATLFTLSGRVAAEKNRECQSKINRNNVAVLNQFREAVFGPHGLSDNINTLKAQELKALEGDRTLPQLKRDFSLYFQRQQALAEGLKDHQLFPTEACSNDNNLPANVIAPTGSLPNSPTTTPSSSVKTTPKPSPKKSK